jgi:hypothetical protein
VDPGLVGKPIADLDAWLDAEGQIHAVYRVNGNASCEVDPTYDPTERVFYAAGDPDPLPGAWPPVTLLEERLPFTTGIRLSNLVRNANGALQVASQGGDLSQNIRLFSISGGNVSEESIDNDSPVTQHYRAAPRGSAQQPMLMMNAGSEWLVREPPTP